MPTKWTAAMVLALGSAMAYFVHRTGGLKDKSSLPRHTWDSVLSLRRVASSLGIDIDFRLLFRLFGRSQSYSEDGECIDGATPDIPLLEPIPFSYEAFKQNDSRKIIDKDQEGLLCFGDISLHHIDVPQTPPKPGEHARPQPPRAVAARLPMATPIRTPREKQIVNLLSTGKARQRRSLSGGSGEMFFELLSLYANVNEQDTAAGLGSPAFGKRKSNTASPALRSSRLASDSRSGKAIACDVAAANTDVSERTARSKLASAAPTATAEASTCAAGVLSASITTPASLPASSTRGDLPFTSAAAAAPAPTSTSNAQSSYANTRSMSAGISAANANPHTRTHARQRMSNVPASAALAGSAAVRLGPSPLPRTDPLNAPTAPSSSLAVGPARGAGVPGQRHYTGDTAHSSLPPTTPATPPPRRPTRSRRSLSFSLGPAALAAPGASVPANTGASALGNPLSSPPRNSANSYGKPDHIVEPRSLSSGAGVSAPDYDSTYVPYKQERYGEYRSSPYSADTVHGVNSFHNGPAGMSAPAPLTAKEKLDMLQKQFDHYRALRPDGLQTVWTEAAGGQNYSDFFDDSLYALNVSFQ